MLYVLPHTTRLLKPIVRSSPHSPSTGAPSCSIRGHTWHRTSSLKGSWKGAGRGWTVNPTTLCSCIVQLSASQHISTRRTCPRQIWKLRVSVPHLLAGRLFNVVHPRPTGDLCCSWDPSGSRPDSRVHLAVASLRRSHRRRQMRTPSRGFRCRDDGSVQTGIA